MAAERMVAISVSDDPDLKRFGFLPQHLRRLVAAVATAALRAGWRIGYGGDLRRDGFTRALYADLASAFARGEFRGYDQAPVVHFYSLSSWGELSPQEILAYLTDQGSQATDAPIASMVETRFFLSSATGRDRDYIGICIIDGELHRVAADQEPVRIEAGSFLDMLETARKVPKDAGSALTAMRRAMARSSPLRVLASGKVAGYAGDRPGIPEEALHHLLEGNIIMPLAAFGGASRDVAIVGGLLDAERVQYPSYGRNYEETLREISDQRDRLMERAAPFWEHLRGAGSSDKHSTVVFHMNAVLERISFGMRAL
jgi:hypothetical protein